MKKLLPICILLFAFSAQFVLSGAQEETTAAAAGPVTLRILWWGGQARHDKTLKVLDMYQQSTPHVKNEPP